MRLGVEASLVEGKLVAGDVSVEDGRIDAVGLAGKGRGIAVPGLLDLQVNGFGGIDLLSADVDAIVDLGCRLLATGVTAYQPTLITSGLEDIRRALAAIETVRTLGRGGAHIIGAHLEGPFLSPQRPGAHPLQHLRLPDWPTLAPILEVGRVTMVTLAPELPGADSVIDELIARGVVVSLGHSDADAQTAHLAFARGASCVTHLFNAMRPFAARDPGIAGVALTRPDVVLQLIVDGVHLSPEAVLIAWHAASTRFVVVSDAIAAACCDPGIYLLGSVEIVAESGVARRPDGTLAGGVGTVLGGLRLLCELGIALEDAAAAATSTPARLMGRPDLGRLVPGASADVVVVDDRLELVRVLREGLPVAEAEA